MDYRRWIEETASLCRPKNIHLCEGTDEEYNRLAAELVSKGLFTPLKRPNSFWCHTHPDDVARVEESTYICSKRKEDAGPTNNWADPIEMHARLQHLFRGCMEGRTLYVIPYCMGPLPSPHSLLGIEITDSPYVVLNMKLMTRMGSPILPLLNRPFVPGVHSVGVPLKPNQPDLPWPCNPAQRVIAHFPEEPSIWSYGSGYGGNALLGKKCLALRIASVLARKQGWLAEHMLILGLTNPAGEKKYIAASFPSSCGKTNLAMMTPSLPNWKVECVGDDIAWLHPAPDGKLYAINPEAGYFGVAPGTSKKSNFNAIKTIEHDTLFTNTALTPDGDVWWEGIGTPPPPHLTSWLGKPWDPHSAQPAAHPNSRFTVSAKQNPIYDPQAENPRGVPLSALIFGGRRSTLIPLVSEAFNWQHGVFLGACLSSETTAAAKGAIGKVRHDPFSMLPFCGYNMGDYFAHWLALGAQIKHPPRIYSVNWFRKGPDGRYLWPGYSENCRILKWIFERTSDLAPAQTTPIGLLPTTLDTSPLSVDLPQLLSIDPSAWQKEADEIATYFHKFSPHMPQPLLDELSSLRSRLKNHLTNS